MVTFKNKNEIIFAVFIISSEDCILVFRINKEPRTLTSYNKLCDIPGVYATIIFFSVELHNKIIFVIYALSKNLIFFVCDPTND